MTRMNNLILFAGDTKQENMPVGYFPNIAMIPLRGKPIIWWQLDNLKHQGLEEFIIVLNEKNIRLNDYVKNVLSRNFKLKIFFLTKKKNNILTSVRKGLKLANPDLPTRVILGDTMITADIDDRPDLILTSKSGGVSEYWCLAVKDSKNVIEKFYDKEKNIDMSDKEIVVGYYSFSDTRRLRSAVHLARLLGKSEISDALNIYKKQIKLKAQRTDSWYDLGHTSGLIKAKNALFNTRSFNSITVCTEYGTLTKNSSNVSKLKDEVFWYKNIPCELQVFTPRLIDFKVKNKKAMLTQELYGYPSLSELFLMQAINLQDWKIILEKLFCMHKKLEKYKQPQDTKAIKWLYDNKTNERLETLKTQNKIWSKLLNKKYLVINGKKYKNICALDIETFVNRIVKNSAMTIVHGDYCLPNILFDASNYLFKLIDPRGRLNKKQTIYGDPRYDIAKLRHSICGLYDFIVNGLYKLSETKNSFNLEIFISENHLVLKTIFDELTQTNGFIPDEIKFIEGLLFLSMVPLHSDDLDRQKALYLKSVILLNETLCQVS